MFWAVVAYSSGIIVGTYVWRPASWWIVAATIFAAAAAYFARKRFALGWSLALGGFFLAGALNIQVGSRTPFDTSIQSFADRQEYQITAHVINDGHLQQAGLGEIKQTVDVETDEIETPTGQQIPIRSGVRLSIYGPLSRAEDADDPPNSNSNSIAPMRAFYYGERIHLFAKLKLPRNFRNPGAFDYQGYLADHGIAALGSAKIADVELLPGFSGNRFCFWRSRIHNSIIAKVHELWPPREAALIDAMVIGEAAFIDRDTRTDFQRSGTYHVLVVSGMNVTILAFVVFWTLRRLRLAEVPATFLTVASCVAYAIVTEVGAPVWRATLMCAIYLGNSSSLPRSRHDQCFGRGRLGSFDLRSATTLHCQLPDDIRLRVDRRRDWHPDLEANLAALQAGARQLGLDPLRFAVAASGRAVPRGSAVHLGSRRTLLGTKVSQAPGSRNL